MVNNISVNMISCTTTMRLPGVSKEIRIDGVDQLAGVSTYLAEAKDGSVSLIWL